MGTNYYFRRDDNRTRYSLGKAYALARRLRQRGSIVVTEQDAPVEIDQAIAVDAVEFDARALARIIEISHAEDGDPERWIAPTGRDRSGASLRLLDLAIDVARWSEGMPISLVSEGDFEDWEDDEAWDEGGCSTRQFEDRRGEREAP